MWTWIQQHKIATTLITLIILLFIGVRYDYVTIEDAKIVTQGLKSILTSIGEIIDGLKQFLHDVGIL